MKHMTRSYPPENAMLREHKESTLEKAQAKRDTKNSPKELNVNSSTDIINKKINERLKRKQKLMDELNKVHDPDFVQ